MLLGILYLLVTVVMSALVLASYVFEVEEAPAYPDLGMLLKSVGLALIWPVLLVARVAIRVDRRFGIVNYVLDRLDRDPVEYDWDPAPGLLTVVRRVAASVNGE